MLHGSESLSLRGPSPAPAVFPCVRRADDDPHAFPFSGRAVRGGEGREKHYPDPAWNRRLVELGGRNLFGLPNFRVTWGYSEVVKDGMNIRYPGFGSCWLVLRRFVGNSAWGNHRGWYEPRVEDGEWVPSFADQLGYEYPYMGEEEVWFAFLPRGTRYCPEYVEYRLLEFLNRPKLPGVDQRMRDHRAEATAKEQEVWRQDYEHFKNVARPFNAQPFVGYGEKHAPPKPPRPEPMTPQMNDVFQRIHAGRMERFRRQGKRVINV